MSRVKGAPRRRSRRWWAVLGGLVVAAVAAVAAGWLAAGEAGTPRLVVDRTEVDLGYLRFDTHARVVFTLTNAGDAPLRLVEVPRVLTKAGC